MGKAVINISTKNQSRVIFSSVSHIGYCQSLGVEYTSRHVFVWEALFKIFVPHKELSKDELYKDALCMNVSVLTNLPSFAYLQIKA